MAVEVFKDRKAQVLKWETGEYEGPVTIMCQSESHASETKLVSNAGFAAVTFPLEYQGEYHATVFDADNNVLDEGDVEVGYE